MEFRPAALKSLRRLSRTDRERILDAVARLPMGDTKRLQGRPGEWRLRVGDWRVRFRRDNTARVIDVLLVLPRGGAYQP